MNGNAPIRNQIDFNQRTRGIDMGHLCGEIIAAIPLRLDLL